MFEDVKGFVLEEDNVTLTPITKDILDDPTYEVPMIEYVDLQDFIHGRCDGPVITELSPEDIDVIYHNMVLIASLLGNDEFPETPTRSSCQDLLMFLYDHNMLAL